jgi:hypothetical protein
MNNIPLITMSPEKRAAISVLMFVVFGVLGIIISIPTLATEWPYILFYALLLWNDYFSIKHFSKIISPRRISQITVDSLLVILHLAAALFFGLPWSFALVMTILFITAILKYSWELSAVKNSRALFRKIKIDSLGAFISAGALVGISFGYPWRSIIVWTLIFAGASVYVILINPLYKDTIGPA